LREWNVDLHSVRLSAKYKHGQNGYVERHIGMLYDLARTIILQNNVPPSLHEDALKYASILLNECRVPQSMDITPEEAFTGKRPSMDEKLIFYQKGASHIFKEERKGKEKMFPKAEIIHFLRIFVTILKHTLSK
jgi:hypothetical protein